MRRSKRSRRRPRACARASRGPPTAAPTRSCAAPWSRGSRCCTTGSRPAARTRAAPPCARAGAAFTDPDEARFHELYREAYAELFEIQYGHAHTVDEDEWEKDWVVVGGTRVPPAVAATMLSPP